MDRRSWLWRRKSTEKSPGETDSSGGSISSFSERFSDEQLKPILEEIESKASKKEYVHLLAECHKLYCEQRLWCVNLSMNSFINFFPSSSEDVSSLAPSIDPLSTYLYDTLRPKLIHEANVGFLCEMVDILRVEVLGEQLSRKSESLAGLRPSLERILADIHECLTFRARTYIRDECGS